MNRGFLEIFIGCCTLKNVQFPWMMFLGSVLNIQGCPTKKHAGLRGKDLGVKRSGLESQVTLNLHLNPCEPS